MLRSAECRSFGEGAKFAMPMAVSNPIAIFTVFSNTRCFQNQSPSLTERTAAVLGINPYFLREYNTAVRNYSLKSTMEIISMLCEYDILAREETGSPLHRINS